MRLDFRKASPPSDDKRWRIVQGTMRRYGDKHHALIETLHTVQETFGYLDEEALRFVATARICSFSFRILDEYITAAFLLQEKFKIMLAQRWKNDYILSQPKW